MCWSTMWGKSQRSYNAAVLPKNPMFHFLFIFGSFLRFRRRVWFTVAIFGSFFISFLVHFYCQPSSVGGKNEPKMKSKMRQKRPKSATVSTPIEHRSQLSEHSQYINGRRPRTIHQVGVTKITRKQPFFKGNEMRL